MDSGPLPLGGAGDVFFTFARSLLNPFIPRAAFVPADHVQEAYRDAPLPIPHGQVTTQPSLVARMVEAARVAASDRVLEVGAGLWVANRAAPANCTNLAVPAKISSFRAPTYFTSGDEHR